jgi:O-antigen/teichoic acid export membrane protein
MTSEIYKKIGRNSIYNLIRRLVAFPAGLILPPVTIKYIGIEGYGIWVLVQTIITYTAVMDMGLSPAITKYTAEYEAREDHFKIVQIFNTLFVVYVFLCFILFVVVFLCRGLIIDFFVKPITIPKETVSFVLIMSALVFCCNMVFSAYPSFLNGLQRMDITNKVGSISSISNCILSIVFLCFGGGIKSLAVAGGITSVITSILYMRSCKKVAPYLTFNPLLFNLKTIKEIWGFSSYGALGNMLAIAQFQSDKLIISYFLGVKNLAMYDVAHRLIFFIWGMCGSIITPIMPAIAHTHAKYGVEKSREVFQTIFKYTSLIVCPLILFVFVFADKLILVWLGTGYENAIPVLRVLSLAFFISVLSGPGASILTGMGFYKICFYGGVITTILTVFLCLILTIKFNILGCAIGFMSAYMVGVFYLFIQLQKVFGNFSMTRFLCNSLISPVVTSMFIFLVANTLVEHFIMNKYIGLMLACMSLLIVYCFVIGKDRRYRVLWEAISTVRL